MKINRRAFLVSAAGIGFAATAINLRNVLGQNVFSTKSISRLRAGHHHPSPEMTVSGYFIAARYKSRAIFEWNFESGKTQKFDTVTAAHVIETHPLDINLSVLSTKRTDTMSMFDWNLKKEISNLQLTNGEFFYGHAVFSDDGRLVLTSSIDRNGAGLINVLEVPSLKKVAVHPVPRGIAHEIAPLGGSEFLFSVGNTNSTPPAFGIFDLSSGGFEYFDVPIQANGASIAMTHLKSCGDLYVGNLNVEGSETLLDGGIATFDTTNRIAKVAIPLGQHGLANELLSLDFDTTRDYVWITVPDQSRIVVWNLKTDSLVKSMQLPQGPLAVSHIPSLDIVVVVTKRRFLAFNPSTIERNEKFEEKAPQSLLTGGKTSHSRLV